MADKQEWVKVAKINFSNLNITLVKGDNGKRRFVLKINDVYPIYLSEKQFVELFSALLTLSEQEKKLLNQILNKLTTTNTTTPTSTNSIDDFINNL